MKKLFIFAAVALVTSVACTHNVIDPETFEGREINFNAVTGKATRGPITNNYFPTDAGNFGVYAYYLASGTWASNYGSGVLYMGTAATGTDVEPNDAAAGAPVEYNSTLKIWNPSSVYYWPLEGTLTFFAYYPATLITPGYDRSTKTFSIGSFTVNTTVSSQKEVLVSSFAVDQTQNTTQYVFGAEEGINSGTNLGVQIQFQHMLSQVVFTAAASSEVYGRGLSFKINDITVGARGTSAGMTVVPGSTPSWTEPTTLATYDILAADFPNATVTPGVAANWLGTSQSAQIGDALLMIPNTDFEGASGTSDDDYFTVTYTLYRMEDGLAMGSKTVKLWFKDNLTSPVTNWEPGKKYTYRLTIGLEKIYFAPEVGNWTDATAQNVEVPGNGTTVTP